MTRTYSELQQLPTFEERFAYLKLEGGVGFSTFGFDRYLNQKFYRSKEWKDIRNYVLVRDGGNDLGVDGYPIYNNAIIHHINPIEVVDLKEFNDVVLNPEFLITVSQGTHNLIHYGIETTHSRDPVSRTPGDTCPWK